MCVCAISDFACGQRKRRDLNESGDAKAVYCKVSDATVISWSYN